MEVDPVVEIDRRIRLVLAGRGSDVARNLPWLAAEALVAGFDSPSLRDLAGRSIDEYPEDLLELLRDSASELGIEVPDEGGGFLLGLYDLCLRVGRGLMVPGDAANEIYWGFDDARMVGSYPKSVMNVVSNAIEYSVGSMDEHPNVADYEDAFVRAAQEFVAVYESGPIDRDPERSAATAEVVAPPPARRRRRGWSRWIQG
ncbi:hypothetical protein FZI91_18175 [Mycobacterium sp. CBMA271]|uniref:hypothetical protein n=1 Tax=unclassified Mycobacteroides TaxID=2618759 RepID=UPI0012DD2200|nr:MULTISPECIES: hypothetical protein [unclassified Mycobacteroides]MUM19361.1 hypothetical protein [Mycobacteroides sp. CBMA 326]MUM23610.1 hypothetical protein [Mycobacteroides sp. CBMA 271]